MSNSNAAATAAAATAGNSPRAEWLNSSEIFWTNVQRSWVAKQPEYLLISQSTAGTLELPLSILSTRAANVRLLLPRLTDAERVSLVKSRLTVELRDASNYRTLPTPVDATGVRLTGMLDEYADRENPLGCFVSSGASKIKKFMCRVWSPAATSVELLLFKDSAKAPNNFSDIKAMTETDHVWEVELDASAENLFYLYRVTQTWPDSLQSETHTVTDPWSKSLSLNSAKSQIVDLENPILKPANWSSHSLPTWNGRQPVIYEAHVRDINSFDSNLRESERGTYAGLINSKSNFFSHLQKLAAAGISHLQLMPVFDFGSANEDRTKWTTPQIPSGLAKDSSFPQELIGQSRERDSYNWGYDPVHLMTPEGSYAQQPDGSHRILEFRQMVQTLHGLKLGVILDVVFNHTFNHGREALSVFDKVVPYYFYRTDANGQVEQSSCCADTASERSMVERWIIDSLVHWSRNYKIDGFRFDLMSFHTKSNFRNIRQALDQLTLMRDGVDGKSIILLGEGWTFGSLVARQPQEAMTQENSSGLGVGTFNDRFRDAIRGGTTSSKGKSDQGWATGLYYDFNQEPANQDTPVDLGDQKNKLGHLTDVVKSGLAGNLSSYSFEDHLGNKVIARDIRFRGAQLGYATSTEETVNYVSAHDGYTLWDAVLAKLPLNTPGRTPSTATLEERATTQRLMLATNILSQGFVFLESGTEILRSRAGDQDGYDSGDWFTFIDYSYQTDRWGVGLPPFWKNVSDVPFWSPRLTGLPSPTAQARTETLETVLNFLKLRARLPHFQLRTAAEVSRRLQFHPASEAGATGLIVMSIDGATAKAPKVLIAINPTPRKITFSSPFPGKVHAIARELTAKPSSRPATQLLIPDRSVLVWEVQ